MKALLRNLLLATTLVAASLIATHAQENAPSDSETAVTKAKMDVDKNPILEKYTWVKNIVNPKDCKGESVSLYYNDSSRTYFLFIESESSRVMYNEEGQVYCTDSKTLDCAKYYELEKQEKSWSCSSRK